jgi:hypothetical protein
MRTIATYMTQRFPVRVFGTAITLHAWIAWWASPASYVSLGWALVLMAVLFVQFRLWDDLEDVQRDRMHHPERVLTYSPVRPFHALLAALAVVSAALLATHELALTYWALLCAGLWSAYRAVRPQLPDPFWRYGVLLLKYPAFVVIVALACGPPIPTRLVVGATVAYIGTALYEAWHHEAGVSTPGARIPGSNVT